MFPFPSHVSPLAGTVSIPAGTGGARIAVAWSISEAVSAKGSARDFASRDGSIGPNGKPLAILSLIHLGGRAPSFHTLQRGGDGEVEPFRRVVAKDSRGAGGRGLTDSCRNTPLSSQLAAVADRRPEVYEAAQANDSARSPGSWRG
jgi:hypothetical protein